MLSKAWIPVLAFVGGAAGAAAFGQKLNAPPIKTPTPIVRPTTIPPKNDTLVAWCVGKPDGNYCALRNGGAEGIQHSCIGGRDSPQNCPNGCDPNTRKCVSNSGPTVGRSLN